MTQTWTQQWQEIELHVAIRRVGADGGSTLRIGPADQPDHEWLRFDCFEREPHWHIDPLGADERHPLDERGDPVEQAFAIVSAQLPALLERAGAPPTVAKAVAQTLTSAEGEALLRDAERAVRHRPALLDELDVRALQQRRSEKWHTYPNDVLPAWVAEMDFPVAAPIQAELRRFTETADVGYPIGLADTGLPEVFSERMADRFGWSTDPRRVEVLSEVVQGLYLALLAYSEEGQGAIVQTPIYPPFLGAVRETGRRLVENRMIASDAGMAFDLDGLAGTIDPETRLLMLCNPHNPSGRVATRSELEKLAEIVLAHDLTVVTDEIHGDLCLDGRRHIPFGSLGPEIARRTLTLTSASKAFNIPGLRCAVAHFGSEELQRRFNSAVPRHVRGGIGLFGIHASIAAWRWAQPWLDEVVPHLEANRDFAAATLAARIPQIRFHAPEATYLAWLDCSGLGIQRSPAAHFLQAGRVALSDGRVFGPGWEQYVRLNFATSRPILTEVLDRMIRAAEALPVGPHETST